MKLVKNASGKYSVKMSRSEWEAIGDINGWDFKEAAKKEEEWPKELKEGRFTEYCKRQGFKGPNKECAEKALDSDDASVRGMASWYLNTVVKKKEKKGD